MTKKTFFGAMAVATAVALTGSALVASNMGFKLNYTLNAAQGGVSADGTNTISLPDNRQTGMVNASNLIVDIGTTNTFSLARYIKSSGSFQSYKAVKNGGADFPLAAGEAYYVKMNTTVNYIVVGSDDPALPYVFNAAQAGVSADGTNFYAYNYHQTAATASGMVTDIGAANTFSVARYIKSSGAFQSYKQVKNGGADFPLVPGEGYYVKMNTTVNYTPSHY
jgi:hypothetical protein